MRLTTLPSSCAVVMKSGNLNFLEPSGPLQACNGTAFFYIRISMFKDFVDICRITVVVIWGCYMSWNGVKSNDYEFNRIQKKAIMA